MGCTNSQEIIQSTYMHDIVGNIEPQMINNYIDRIPLFILHKIKTKFDLCSRLNSDLTENEFKLMFKPYIVKNVQFVLNNFQTKDLYINQFLNKLFLYFTNEHNSKLLFKLFIEKYAILNKCEDRSLSDIMFYLYSDTQIQLKKQYYNKFIQEEKKFFTGEPSTVMEEKIDQEKFYQLLKSSQFLWQDYRLRFSLVNKDELPFQAITEAIDTGVVEFEVGVKYYLLSSSWFEKWRYYYTQIPSDESGNKPTTLKKKSQNELPKKKKQLIKEPVNRRDSTYYSIIERPSEITFEDIEGEYRGQLKQNIKVNYDITILSLSIWQMLKQTIAGETQFTRYADTTQTLDLYPKSIYFFQTNNNGEIIDNSFQLISVSKQKKIKDLNTLNNQQNKKKSYFMKNLGSQLWMQCSQQQPLFLCSQSKRFIVIQTYNKNNFIDFYSRKKINKSNATYGDKVYSFFAFTKKFVPGYIIRIPSSKKVLIHYIGYSFRYEVEVEKQDIFVNQKPQIEAFKNNQKKAMNDSFSFKGIQNIGNTCFINSIIQCLIASPILQNYLISKKFKQSKQPLLFEISEIAKALLINKSISPVNFKKTIDQQLQVFSGYNQHDAQQFLNLLIVKLNEQTKKVCSSKETIFDFLFNGQVQSTLQCLSCPNKKQKMQDFSIVSLPLPEPSQIMIITTVFPIYNKKIKKIVLRLALNSFLFEYVKKFEQKVNRSISKFIFVNGSKKISPKYFEDKFRKMTLRYLIPQFSELGIISNLDLYCFQKFKDEQLLKIKEENTKAFNNSMFFQYHDQQLGKWMYGRYITKSQQSEIEILRQDFSVINKKNKKKSELMTKPLGTQLGLQITKELLVRKLNETLNKIDSFGTYFLITFPISVTFRQLEELVHLCMKNMLIQKNKKQYFIKLCFTPSRKCIFCKQEQQSIVQNKKYPICCRLTEKQKDTPLIWIAMRQHYVIFIDFQNMTNFNVEFRNSFDWDPPQEKAQELMKSEKIKIEDCLVEYQKPQNVEMECEKCKNKIQRRTEIMKNVPNILILHMKEYRMGVNKNLIKMHANLKWIEFFDISNYSVGQKGTIYQLYAYVTHYGTSQSGHYTCAVKRKHPFQSKKVWVLFDDQITVVMEKEQKNIDSAYLLFFKRIDMPNSAYINFTDF